MIKVRDRVRVRVVCCALTSHCRPLAALEPSVVWVGSCDAGGKRVDDVEGVLSVGQKVLVEISKIDDRGKLSLSPVVAEEGEAAAE